MKNTTHEQRTALLAIASKELFLDDLKGGDESTSITNLQAKLALEAAYDAGKRADATWVDAILCGRIQATTEARQEALETLGGCATAEAFLAARAAFNAADGALREILEFEAQTKEVLAARTKK